MEGSRLTDLTTSSSSQAANLISAMSISPSRQQQQKSAQNITAVITAKIEKGELFPKRAYTASSALASATPSNLALSR
jgi:hypothetical protein